MPNPFLAVIESPKDVNRGTSPYALPPEIWSDANNVSFENNETAKVGGYTEFFAANKVASHPPSFALFFTKGANSLWFFGSNNAASKLYSISTTSTYTDVSRTSGGAYSALNAPSKWTGDVFHGIAILNHSSNIPQYYDQNSTNFENFPVAPGWRNASDRVGKIVPFGDRLVAINIINLQGATPAAQPYSVLWSEATDPGTLPTSWDFASSTSTAGLYALSKTDGALLDAVALKDALILYKEDTVHIMRFIGGTFVHSFKDIFSDDGILGEGCAVDFGGKHFVISRSDIYIHDGITKRSISDQRIKDAFFGAIAEEGLSTVFAYYNKKTKECYACYPSIGSTYCDKAWVWSTKNNSWAPKDLPDCLWIATGPISEVAVGNTFADLTGSYDSIDDSVVYDGPPELAVPEALICASGDGANGKFYKDLTRFQHTTTAGGGVNYRTFVERIGLALNDDPSQSKYLHTLYPALRGTGTVSIQVGYEDIVGAGYTWNTAQTFTIGTDHKLDIKMTGKLFGIRIESTSDAQWILDRYTFEGNLKGRKGDIVP